MLAVTGGRVDVGEGCATELFAHRGFGVPLQRTGIATGIATGMLQALLQACVIATIYGSGRVPLENLHLHGASSRSRDVPAPGPLIRVGPGLHADDGLDAAPTRVQPEDHARTPLGRRRLPARSAHAASPS